MLPFFALKALSFLPFGNIFRSKLFWIGLAVVVVVFLVWRYNERIREEVRDQIYAEQAEEIAKQNQQELRRLEQLLAEQEDALQRLQESRRDTQRVVEGVQEVIRDNPSDGAAPPVIQGTLRRLREHQGGAISGRPPEPTPRVEVEPEPTPNPGPTPNQPVTTNPAILEWQETQDAME